MHKITDDVYITSVLNPNIRVFDVVMCTEFGTSYNSYVVVGSEKIAIIDANHATFTDDWLAKVECVLKGRTPDYLVLNHTEPDHSGSVAACLALYPNITLVCSAAAAINLRNITNQPELAAQVVKTGDSLDLGGLTLEFLSAPFLHWPDTLFTWLPERKVVFTCDFLGAHYCEPRLFDHAVIYRDKYVKAVKEYYDAIMAPFASWVRKGLDILKPLNAEVAATSHGPILTKDGELSFCIERYEEWSAAASEQAPQTIALFYCSAYGNTKALAEHIKKGIERILPQAQIQAHDLVQADIAALAKELNAADAVLIGSPTINKDALPPVWNLLAGIDAINFAKRPVALFGSYGWSGEALPALADRLSTLKATVYDEQLKVKLVPSEDDLKAAERFGADFAASLA